ncbi:hypothetical protein GCM10015535_11230 [Streptomyces gelaticus]|uniref:LPXTG cell wall anchor domain-containing protein n=1 Tax=Streptomyces gelaticus TaxID=285446 RepID=A0ABQ2VVC0_9ACTN|nr:hypothetical protein [Streptomyces gelaticus]GGV77645.1 hypothetical protein GCM10015535_11230 [Streptomyces gelaticus]
MRPARLVTGTAASAVTIATLGFLTAGPSAYAGDADTPRTGAAGAVSRTTGDLGTRATTGDEIPDDGAGGDEAGSGTGNPFSLDTLSGLNAPSLLDSASGGAFSGLNAPGEDDNPSEDEDTDRGESSSGHDSSSSSKHDGSGGRESWSPSEKEGSGKRDDSSSSGHDSSASGQRPGDTPTGPTGHVKTGVGGSVRPDTTQIAAGAGVLATAAVGGAWLLRRRASGTQGAG